MPLLSFIIARVLNSPKSRKRTRQRRRRHSSRSPVRRCTGSRRPPARRRSSARVSRWPGVCSRTPDSKRASAPTNPRWTWCSTRSKMSESWWSWGTGTFRKCHSMNKTPNMYEYAKRRKCSESFFFWHWPPSAPTGRCTFWITAKKHLLSSFPLSFACVCGSNACL